MKLLSPLRTAALALVFGAATAASAAPVSFTVTPDSFTPGTGYGTGVGDLDVGFAVDATPQSFSLASAGDAQTFKFGTVTFSETGFISALETGALGVSATFSFLDPLAGLKSVTATGTAIAGVIADAAVDFSIVWDTVTVAFGSGGSFEISMNSLSFSRSGQSLEQDATIRLLSAPTAAVPEPATLALVLVGLAFAGGVARRRAG